MMTQRFWLVIIVVTLTLAAFTGCDNVNNKVTDGGLRDGDRIAMMSPAESVLTGRQLPEGYEVIIGMDYDRDQGFIQGVWWTDGESASAPGANIEVVSVKYTPGYRGVRRDGVTFIAQYYVQPEIKVKNNTSHHITQFWIIIYVNGGEDSAGGATYVRERGGRIAPGMISQAFNFFPGNDNGEEITINQSHLPVKSVTVTASLTRP